MKPWLILTGSAALVVLIVLTLLFGDSAPKVDKNPVPKELPRPAVGGGDADSSGDLAAAEAEAPLGVLLSGELPADGWEVEISGDLRPAPPLENPPTVPATATTALQPDDLVLGVQLNNQARAYPLKFLAAPGQEVLNDQLAGEPLTITWNPALRSAVVFHNPPSDLALVFRSTGQTWNTDLLFQDQSTESYWSQTLGRCVRGQLLGSPLRGIPSAVCTWQAWSQAFPQTTVCQLPVTAPAEAVLTSPAAVAAARKTGQVLVISPDGERELSRAELFENRVLNTTAGTHYAACFYDDLADSVRALDPMLVVKPLTFELRGLKFTLTGSNSAWNILNGNAEDEGIAPRPLRPLLVLELPTELQQLRRPTGASAANKPAPTPPPASTSGS